MFFMTFNTIYSSWARWCVGASRRLPVSAHGPYRLLDIAPQPHSACPPPPVLVCVCRYRSDSHVYAFFVLQWISVSIAVMLLFLIPETLPAVSGPPVS
jgi:hypothetical protein